MGGQAAAVCEDSSGGQIWGVGFIWKDWLSVGKFGQVINAEDAVSVELNTEEYGRWY